MPRRNKRRIFGRGNKNKKRNASSSAEQQHQECDDSESDENAIECEESALVGHDSASAMGQLGSLSSSPEGARATITLKVIQFVGEHPRRARVDESAPEATEIEVEGNKSIGEPTITAPTVPHNEFGDVPETDHNEPSGVQSFDDNYRVESPRQMCIESVGHSQQRTKRHAMLIQEISESSSSEEVKQFLDAEAKALESKPRVESPASSDESNSQARPDEPLAQEISAISESSSTESVKNEILASISRQPPAQSGETRAEPLKIINIKELPSDSPPAKTIAQFECRVEKKLNKAEEAILEALYGNKNLLQIPNQPLDVISEEGSECGSEAERQPRELLDDEVFLPRQLMTKPPRRLPPRVAEQPLLLNAKIIETESNIPEGCKSWETSTGDSAEQAELVYLTSTSSSATDLSERGDFSDTEEADEASDDTETNSMLDNISVPPLEFDHDKPIEMRSTIFYQEIADQKLEDILEEDEDSAPRSLDIVESQQQIENVNLELHHLSDEHERQSDENTHEASDKSQDKPKDDRVTPTTPTLLFKRTNSSDSTSSSSNSQCTIIQPRESIAVNPLRELCVESLMKSGMDGHCITVHKRLNSSSRNAPQLPIIDQLELRCDGDLGNRENRKVITIMQVPPDMSHSASPVTDKVSWLGLQSTQIPNLLVALSPLQMSHVMKSPDSQTNADVLLDMHKKFVERRAYHEGDQEDGYFGDRENSVENIIDAAVTQVESNCDSKSEEKFSARASCRENSRSAEVDGEMNSLRSLVERESRDDAVNFESKKSELECELKRLDEEKKELEEELKNLRSLQHFKREEFLFTEQKLQDKIQQNSEAFESRNSVRYANDDFNEFLYSNERLQQELYNEWQDKVLERNERKMQKTIKITSVASGEAVKPDENLKFVPLENEFMSKLKERQKRLSLPTEAELNSSTESLHHQNEAIKSQVTKDDAHIPPHLYEFIKYYEEEASAQNKNSADESGESNMSLAKPVLLGLIGVSMCLCGLYIGKHFITQTPKLL